MNQTHVTVYHPAQTQKTPNRPATFPPNSMAVLHNAAGEHAHPHADTRAHTENRRRHRARPWRTQCLTQSRRLVMKSRFCLASHKILRPECLLCFAGSSHSVNNGPVSEWRCRQCAVGPTIQSLTHSSHRAILLFYIPEAKSYLSPAGRVGVSVCLSVCLSGLRSTGRWASQPTHLLFVLLLAVHQYSLCPLGWWTPCGLRRPTVSQGWCCLSGSRHTHTHTDSYIHT